MNLSEENCTHVIYFEDRMIAIKFVQNLKKNHSDHRFMVNCKVSSFLYLLV